jgi:hypothetical protein
MLKTDIENSVQVAPLRLGNAVWGFAWIYGLTIVSCALINVFVQHFPIGPWTGADIGKQFWLDNVTWQIFAVGWACLFAVCGFWPFNQMTNALARGIAVTVASWALGWLTAKAIFVTGLGADWIFPFVGTSWFFLAFFCFNGENWIVRNFQPGRQFFLLLVLIGGLTYIVTHSEIRWIPAWWFPFNLVGASTGLLAYLTRRMTQPGKSMTQMLMLFLSAGAAIWISAALGFWDPKAHAISSFWTIGEIGSHNAWLVLFMIGTSINFAFPVMLNNWPFSKIPMPWGGVIACLFYLGLDVAVTALALHSVGTIFSSNEQLLTYAYMGVNWSLVMPLVFGFGMNRPYLWAGQRTPGTWEDVE